MSFMMSRLEHVDSVLIPLFTSESSEFVNVESLLRDSPESAGFALYVESTTSDANWTILNVSRGNQRCWSWRKHPSIVSSIVSSDCFNAEIDSSRWQWIQRVQFNSSTVFDWYLWLPNRLKDDESTLPRTALPSAAARPVRLADDAVFNAERSFTNTGFHGVISTRVSIPASLRASQCRLQLIELLPRAVFVDEYQVRNLELFDVSRPRATLSGPVDLEVPVYSARAVDFAVRLVVDVNNRAQVTFELPVHGRYQHPKSKDLYTDIAIEPAVLFVQCGAHDAQWRSAHLLLSPESTQLQWRLPNGVSSHFPVVKYGTLSSTVMGALVVILAILISHFR